MPTITEVEEKILQAAIEWQSKRKDRTYNNAELAALWDACALRAAMKLLGESGDQQR